MTTQFGDKYRALARITKATMRIHHKPGDAMQVDWAGDTLSVYDSVTGEITPAYLFIAVLPCSCYIYAEATADMKLEELNREFRQREGCRRSAYLEEEKAFMKPLPAQRYEFATLNPNIKVGTDYLVSDGRNKYSVFFLPYAVPPESMWMQISHCLPQGSYPSDVPHVQEQWRYHNTQPFPDNCGSVQSHIGCSWSHRP